MNQSESVKISQVVGAIDNLITTKIESDSALTEEGATFDWVAASREIHQNAMIELAGILENYIEQRVQEELEKRK